MKILILFLTISFLSCSICIADNLVPPFTEVKKYVETKGKIISDTSKFFRCIVPSLYLEEQSSIDLVLVDNIFIIITSIIDDDPLIAMVIGYDIKEKLYFKIKVINNFVLSSEYISLEEATEFGFANFYILVSLGCI